MSVAGLVLREDNLAVQDHELYRPILGIEAPWFVDSVELKLEAGEIHVYLRPIRG